MLYFAPLLWACQSWELITPAACDEEVVVTGIAPDEASRLGFSAREALENLAVDGVWAVEPNDELGLGPGEAQVEWTLAIIADAELVSYTQDAEAETWGNLCDEREVLRFPIAGEVHAPGWFQAAGSAFVVAASDARIAHDFDTFTATTEPAVAEALEASAGLTCPDGFTYYATLSDGVIGVGYQGECEEARTGGTLLSLHLGASE